MGGLPTGVHTAWPERWAGFVVSAGAAVVLCAVFLVTLCLSPMAARATGLEVSPAGPVESLPATDDPSATPRLLSAGTVSEWSHIQQVVAWLRYRLPPRHVVYLFGGSAVRESVFSESDWKAEMRAVSGLSVATYVVASRCQTYPEDLRIVSHLPKNRGIALIGVGPTRFSMVHKSGFVSGTAIRTSPPGPWYQHHYDYSVRLSAAEKRRLVRAWVRDRYGVFVARYPDRLAELDKLVQVCIERGVRPVLFEMPLNLPVIGHAFDKARATYQRGCLWLAAKYDLEYIRFVSRIGLRSSDFYDLQHLLPSGRAKWQARLSRELVWRRLL